MEVSALKYSGRGGLSARSPLLRLQSDERLVAVIRRGNVAAFELLVSRYETRLLSFCRHLLRSREDAEDVLQEVLAAAYGAMLSDDRPINVRPWLYRIARNRCLNHLRKAQAVGVDSMDVHFSDNGASTADKVHDREEFRQLVGDIHGLPETQRTALVLREMDALSYEQIAEAMDTTVPSVKSLLVRARVSLAEASESRLLSCEEVREQLGEIAEGLVKKANPAVRRHVKSCSRCNRFEKEIRHSSKALAAALVPLSAIGMLRKLLLVHLLGHSAGTGAAGAAGASATGTGAVASATAAGAGATASVAGGASSAGLISAGVGAVATKAAAGLAAAALVTAGTVAVSHDTRHHTHRPTGFQVLNASMKAGVARSDATAPVLAAPVRILPPAKLPQHAKPVKHAARVAKAKRHVVTPAVSMKSVTPTPVSHAPASHTPVTSTPVTTTPAAVTTATTPTATAASVVTPAAPATANSTVAAATATPTTAAATTPTTATTTSTTATTATTTTATTTTPTVTTTTPTGTSTAPISTTTPTSTTPTTTSTSASSPPTGGTGLLPSSPLTTTAAAVTAAVHS
jgi:RNA polymerase sigma factor (sigma-70 family)